MDKKYDVFKIQVAKINGKWKITKKEATENHVMISQRDADVMNANFYRSKVWYELSKDQPEEKKKAGRPAKENK